jgi:hypothetical protein
MLLTARFYFSARKQAGEDVPTREYRFGIKLGVR